MKVMWIMAVPMGKCAKAFGNTILGSGGWIDACIDSIQPYSQIDLELHVVALSNINDYCFDSNEHISYHLVKCPQIRGRTNPIKDLNDVKQLIDKIVPDVIHVWGTEYSIGLDLFKITDIPIVFFIQGVMNNLAVHPNGDLKYKEYFKLKDCLLIPKLFNIIKNNYDIKKQAILEYSMISKCDGIIVDNEWAANHYYYSNTKKYYVSLPINEAFSLKNWNYNSCKPHTIFTIAGRTPLKGLHILIKALALVKRKYPDIELLIPGNVEFSKPSFVYKPLYIEYLNYLIDKYELTNNVKYLGKLSQEDMAMNMESCNLFVMPSCVENHSSTLREALTVGCPCVSSVVGSVCEFVAHEYNGLLYRYDDIEMLAGNIISILDNENKASYLSRNAKESIKEYFPQSDIGKNLMDVYEDLITNRFSCH